MSRRENNLKTKNNTTISTESNNKKEIAQTKTSQSLNTESYEYYNQKTTSKNNITESPNNTLNQQSNSRYSSIQQSSNPNIVSQRHAEQNETNFAQEEYCTCDQTNENLENNDVQCNCQKPDDQYYCTCNCDCGQFDAENMRNESGNANYNYQIKKQQKIVSSSNYNNNANQNSRTYQISRQSGGHDGKVIKSTIETNKKVITYVSPNNPKLQISDEKIIESNEAARTFERNVCTCPDHDMNDNQDMEGSSNVKRVENYSYYDSNSKEGSSSKSKNDTYNYNRRTYEYRSNTNKSYSSDNRFIREARVNRDNTNIQWNMKCVGQNNESLQILAEERPKLIAQSVQDMQVIQEPRPVQILLPIQDNEIDYTLGLEIYGKNSEEERKALKEAERLRKLMAICPENIEALNIQKAYETIVPHFGELNIDKKEELFCHNQRRRKEWEH